MPRHTFEQLEAIETARSKARHALRLMLDSDREYAFTLAEAVLAERAQEDPSHDANGSISTVERPRRSRRHSTREKVLQWFADYDNEWVSVGELAERMVVNRNTLAHLMQHTELRTGLFDTRKHPTMPRRNQFRLANPPNQQGDREP